MKQDVTVDGSLHPSKHGTLAESALTPPSSSPSFSLPHFVSHFNKELRFPQTFPQLLADYFAGSEAITLTVQ